MPAPRHLSRAPIKEAIIDYRVKARPGFDAQRFTSLKDELAPQFPKIEQGRGGKVTFKLSAAGTQPPEVVDLGLQAVVFRSQDAKLLVQFRTDGFTVNRLSPYTSWAEISPLAYALWGRYVDIAAPEAVTRLALRYVNHVPLPPDMKDFAQYLRASPVIPAELPQYVSSFATRTTIHDPDRNIAAHVAQTLQPDAKAQRSTLVLDIDAFCEGSWEPTDPNVRQVFEDLHQLKNLVFFSVLTDDALRLFE